MSHSLDTDSFLGAFTRFTARRGVPRAVFSDNGTNFTAAEKELREMVEQLDQSKICHQHSGIKWTFLPTYDSHMAGVLGASHKIDKDASENLSQRQFISATHRRVADYLAGRSPGDPQRPPIDA